MSRIDVPCPQCGKLLTIPDRSLLGKKGKCPRCQHKFLLSAPPEGITFQEAAESDAVEDHANPVPHEQPAAAVPQDHFPQFPLNVATGDLDSTPPAVSRKRRRAQGPFRWIALALLLIAAGGGFAVWSNQKPTTKREPKKNGTVAKAAKTESSRSLPAAAGFPQHGNPTKGKPITLNLVPLGARMVIHLRPAELWKQTESREEFLNCLGPLVPAIEEQLAALCLFKPENLESVVLAFIPVSRDAFDVAAVVRTTADFKRSDLISRFDGELVDSPRPHFVGPQRVFLIQDRRTFASAPKGMIETFLDAAERPLDVSEGLESMLARSDSERHFTIAAELEDLRNGVPTLAPPAAQKLLRSLVDFFGDDVEAFRWSFQLGDSDVQSNFYSDLSVRNLTTRSPKNLSKDLREKLAAWPGQTLDLVYKTQPETIGHKKLVGRFPMMTKIVEQSLQENHSGRLVNFTLELPSVAAPNLAAGTLLAWDYTTRSSFGKGAAPTTPSEGDKPASIPIAERLKKPINVEFKNEFLFKALEFIQEEIGVKIKTDGPGMQRVGVTQNQRQDMKFENTPATVILHEMLVKRLKDRELCIWIDEANNQVVVTSQVVAEEQKRTIFPLKPQ